MVVNGLGVTGVGEGSAGVGFAGSRRVTIRRLVRFLTRP